jgi:nucleoside-diphosphate-sugar epimerase
MITHSGSKTHLVAGATGFVGSHLIDALLARRLRVRALVRDVNKAADLEHRGVEVVVGDMIDAKTWNNAVRGADTIYHCAAVTENEVSASQAHEANLTGLRNLLDAVRSAGRGRVVLLTGLSVLGVRDLDNATEDLPRRRRGDPDIDAKVEAEELALQYHEQYGVDLTILRPSFIYGPRDLRNLPSLVNAIRAGKFIYLGSRQNIVPLVHVQDAVRAMLLAASSERARGRVYHIADGTRTTMEEVVTFLACHIGAEPPRHVLPVFSARAVWLLGAQLVRFGCLHRAPLTWSELLFVGTSRFVDVSRAEDELGYAPRVMFREGMAATLKWIDEKENEHSSRPSHATTIS